MKTIPAAGPGSAEKAAAIVSALADTWAGRVIDVGCRSRELAEALEEHSDVSYVGIDLTAPPGQVAADLGDGLPVRTAAADIVVALDVLEHTDDIHAAFAELCRVAHGHVVISLPNCLDIKSRWRVATGRQISGKYGLSLEARTDRHRWFFGLREAQRFCRHRARVHGFEIVEEFCLVGPARDRMVARPLVRRWPNLLAPTYVALLRSGPARQGGRPSG